MKKLVKIYSAGLGNYYGSVQLNEYDDGTYELVLEDWGNTNSVIVH